MSTADVNGETCQPNALLGLPDELLCIILARVADTEPPDCINSVIFEDHPRTRVKLLGWLRLSEVCARFRALLLSMATLWAGVVFQLPVKPGKLALARSKSALLPMDILSSYQVRHSRGDAHNAVFEHMCGVAVQNAARMCSLKTCDLSFATFKELTSAPLPHLKELRMDCNSSCPMGSSQDLDEISVDAPNVRHVELTFHRVPFHIRAFAFQLPALLSLDIGIQRSDGEVVLKPSWIAEILLTSRLLRKISLRMYASPTTIDWDALFNERKAILPHLRSLTLKGDVFTNIPSLYKHIESPWPVRFEASCTALHGEVARPGELPPVLGFVDMFGPLLAHSPHRCLAICLGDRSMDTGPHLSLQRAPARGDPIRRTDPSLGDGDLVNFFEVAVTLSDLADHADHVRVARAIAHALQGNDITQLFISSPSLDVWPEAIEAIIAACPAVTELDVRYDSYGALARGFPVPFTASMFPALDCVFFGPGGDHALTDEDRDGDLACWEECVAWLAFRAQAGLRVRRLEITGQEGDEMDHDIIGPGKINEEMYAQAAEYVDEFTDARKTFDWSSRRFV